MKTRDPAAKIPAAALGPRVPIPWIASLALVSLVTLFVWGAMRQATRVNVDSSRSDQGAYLGIMNRMRSTHFRYLGDRNRMPLYPVLQALVAVPGAGPEATFERAKRVNVLLSVLILAALFPILRAWLPGLQALNVLLITAFTVFMFKAGWVQAELLFYFLSFAAWLALVELLRKPSSKQGVLAGVLVGFAYLTKASILPTMVIWALWSAVVMTKELWRNERTQALSRLASTGVAVLMAVAVVFPYLADNKRIYGHWLYNVNTNFYVWYDSWSEAARGAKAHGAMERWPSLQPDQIPSLHRYLDTHTTRQIVDRLGNGSIVVLKRALRSYGYFDYIVLYGGLAAFLLWRNRSWSLRFAKHHWAVCGFLVSYFMMSFLLVAWYVPIASGNRFILAHFLPLLFTISFATAAAPTTYLAGRPVSRLGNRAILILILADLPLRLVPQTSWLNGGH